MTTEATSNNDIARGMPGVTLDHEELKRFYDWQRGRHV